MASYPLSGYIGFSVKHFYIGISMLRTPYLVYIGFSTEQFCIIISMASYPLPGLYRIQYKTFCIGLSMASYPQLGLRRIWSALDTTRFCRHMWYQPTRTLSPLKCGLFSWFHRKTDRETDWKVFGFGFGFFRFCCKNRPKPTDIFVKNRKTDRALFHFRFTTVFIPLPQVQLYRTAVIRSCLNFL